MSDHLGLDALADVLAGVAAPEHLDTCASCRARLAELSAAVPAVSASLAALPTPPEPPDLPGRVHAALAAEHAEQRPAPGPADVVPLAARRTRSGQLWKVAAGIAAGAVLVTGAVLVVQQGGDSTSTQAGKGWRASSTGTDYAAGIDPLKAQLPALLAGTAPTAAPEADTARTPLSTGPTTAGSTSATKAVGTGDALARLRTTEGLAQCLIALSDPGADVSVPLALDYARYKGAPALVVVLPATKPDKVDVFIVGAGCAAADAKLLFFARLVKP
jgi:hypothetical protein